MSWLKLKFLFWSTIIKNVINSYEYKLNWRNEENLYFANFITLVGGFSGCGRKIKDHRDMDRRVAEASKASMDELPCTLLSVALFYLNSVLLGFYDGLMTEHYLGCCVDCLKIEN